MHHLKRVKNSLLTVDARAQILAFPFAVFFQRIVDLLLFSFESFAITGSCDLAPEDVQ
jgi:hypothetical protein